MTDTANTAWPALDAVNITAGYGRHTVLRDVSVRVAEGELVSLIGANGAGKSTLFRCLSGRLKLWSGTISLFGESIQNKAPHQVVRAGLGQVPEGRQIFAGLNVSDHLRLAATYGARLKGEAVADLLDRVHTLFPLLKERSGQTAGTLSGGQQQMLVIGRALMTRPRMLILDEPSLGLAPLAAREIFRSLVELNRSGVAVLLVEQNAMLALRLSHRAYVLQGGRIVRQGLGADMAQDTELIAHYVGTGSAQGAAGHTAASPEGPSSTARAKAVGTAGSGEREQPLALEGDIGEVQENDS